MKKYKGNGVTTHYKSVHYLLQIGLVALAYYLTAHLGIALEAGQRGVLPMPLSAGVALAILLLFGIRLWPGIALGCLFWHNYMDVPWLYSSSAILGSTLQAIVAVIMLQRGQFHNTFSRLRDVLLFAITVLILAPALGSTISNTTLVISNAVPWEFIIQIWISDWFSDGMSMLVIGSTLVVWRNLPTRSYIQSYVNLLEWTILLTSIFIVSLLTLNVDYEQRIILLYTILPFTVWAAVRFEQHGASLASLLIASVLLSGGIDRLFPYIIYASTADILLEIGFIGINTLTAFLVAAAYSERREKEKHLYRQKEKAWTTLHSIADAVITTNEHGKIVYLNPAAENLLGYQNKHIVNKPLEDIFTINHNEASNILERCLEGMVSPHRQCLLNNYAEREIPIKCSAAPIRSHEGRIEGAILLFHDISKEHDLHKQLSHHATHDALTGLYNRREFEYQLKQLLHGAKTEGETHSLLYIDLDNFKLVNDTCGHIAGDTLLKQLVMIIQERVRRGDIFARLGGDEFGILLRNCPIHRAGTVAENFLNTIRGFRFTWQEQSFTVGASIGVVAIDAQSYNFTTILSKADSACYAAKDNGRNRIYIVDEINHLAISRPHKKHWTTCILKALEQQRFILYKQKMLPFSHNETQLERYEILLRMQDETNQILLPGSFLSEAERYYLMPRIDRWVIEQVFKYLQQRHDQNETIDLLSINISSTTINDPSFAHFLTTLVTRFQLPTHCICFEITETTVISFLEKVMEFIQLAKKLGFRIALDDFGGSVASFNYLKSIHVDYLKIDGNLIQNALSDTADMAIIEAINHIAHSMEIQTIGKWVEDEATLKKLRNIKIDYGQGFFISAPELLLN